MSGNPGGNSNGEDFPRWLERQVHLNDGESNAWLSEVESFPLDDPRAQFPFTARLAKEQGWSLAFAGKVVIEYKRFMALAVVAGHPVTPPDAVDQAWHLHLVYTRSYWKDFCGGVLGKEIHHSPTTGGAAESDKFQDWYCRTLASYQRIFGETPDAGIWPPPQAQAHSTGSGRWVDAHEFWLLRRPRWWRRITRTLPPK